MLAINNKKLNNSYIIETTNFINAISSIKEIATNLGFDKELLDNDTHLDFRIIHSIRQDEKNKNELRKIKIDEVREEIINDSAISPSLADRKIYVIYDFSDFTENQQNALLKTIEEPNENVHFFFLASNVSTVINTIKSRSLILFDNYDYKLEEIYENQNINYDVALKLFSNLNNVSIDDIYEFTDDYINEKHDIKLLLKLLRYFVRDTYVYKYTFNKDKLQLKINFDYIDKFKEIVNTKKISGIINELDYLSKEINTNIDKRLALNMLFINIKNIL